MLEFTSAYDKTAGNIRKPNRSAARFNIVPPITRSQVDCNIMRIAGQTDSNDAKNETE